jgi:UDP-galactopyranose mutase
VAGIECSYLPTYDVDVTETNGHQTHLAADLAAAGLGTYKYLDMHMAIASALTLVDNKLGAMLSNER